MPELFRLVSTSTSGRLNTMRAATALSRHASVRFPAWSRMVRLMSKCQTCNTQVASQDLSGPSHHNRIC